MERTKPSQLPEMRQALDLRDHVVVEPERADVPEQLQILNFQQVCMIEEKTDEKSG